jgi:hypothetical protein
MPTISDLFDLKNNELGKLSLDTKYKQFQVMGGFELPTDKIYLDRLKIENVLERLENMIGNNIIAVSELKLKDDEEKKNLTTNKSIEKLKTLKVNAESFNSSDDGFLHRSSSGSGSGNNKLYNGILNIHFSGDGPKNFLSITDFINKQITSSLTPEINIICGDSNITLKKLSDEQKKKIKTRQELVNEIANGLNEAFNLTDEAEKFIVFMSNIKVGKLRKGFILLNQQSKKSVKNSENAENGEETEEDGTLIAIKKKYLLFDGLIEFIKTAKYYCSDNSLEGYTIPIPEYKPALSFKNDSYNVLGPENRPIEKVFLDHSVMYFPFNLIKGLDSLIYSNLVVLNLGSMINADKKNWNTQYIDKIDQIKKGDKALFDAVNKVLEGNLGMDIPSPYNYNNFNKNVLKREISEADFTRFTEALKSNASTINKIITDLHDEINQEPAPEERKILRRWTPPARNNPAELGYNPFPAEQLAGRRRTRRRRRRKGTNKKSRRKPKKRVSRRSRR